MAASHATETNRWRSANDGKGARRAVLAGKAERPVSASKAVVCRVRALRLDHRSIVIAGLTGGSSSRFGQTSCWKRLSGCSARLL